MVILDTNILIDHIRRPKSTDSHLVKLVEQFPKEQLVISPITIQELYNGLSSKTSLRQKLFIAIIASFKILPYNIQVAQLAGEIARDLDREIEFPDAAIAATSILNKAKLFTLNKKDFKEIKDLKLI